MTELRSTLAAAGVPLERPVLVCVGGAGGMTAKIEREVGFLLRHSLVPMLEELGVVAVDGGTDSGFMRSLGRTRDETGASFPLIGVAAEGTVILPHHGLRRPNAAELEQHHTHAVLVPGDTWGDESPWVSAVAGAISGGNASVTLLVNGGAITLDDAEQSLAEGRPLVILAGSGRVADDIASCPGGSRPARIAADDRTHIVSLSNVDAVVNTLNRLLTC